MTQPDDWERWRATWAQPPIGDLEAVAHRATRARRRMRVLIVVELLIVAAAVGVIAAAVRHAANPFEVALALVAAAISVWALAREVATRRAEVRLLGTALTDYPTMLMALRRREIAMSRFTVLVVGALLLFLVLWWSGGWAYHRGQFLTPLSIGLFWVPLAGSIGLLVWSFRVGRLARQQLEQISRQSNEDTQ